MFAGSRQAGQEDGNQQGDNGDNDKNLDQLRRCGLEHFKRTVNQNYFNWLPTDFSDPQLLRLLDHWRKSPTLQPLRARLDDTSHVETIADANGLDTADKRAAYALFVGLLWDYARRGDRLDLIAGLEEPEAGDPIRVLLDGQRISQDLANSVRECNAMLSGMSWRPTPANPLHVAELGAGYGRLAYVLLAGLPCRYFIFDIPPALAVSQAYLQQVFPGKRCFPFRHFKRYEEVRGELESAEICFFTPNQLALVPEHSFDVFSSISSLGEMKPAQIDNYKRLIERTTRDVVYFKQWATSINDHDGVVIERDTYRLSDDWHAVTDRLDEVQAGFFETVYCRSKVLPPRGDSRHRLAPHHARQVAGRMLARVRDGWANWRESQT